MPINQVMSELPRDVSHVALDERSNTIIAFRRDGSEYGSFDVESRELHDSLSIQARGPSGSCSALSVDQAKTRK